MVQKSVNIRDVIYKKFEEYKSKEPVNFTDTVNRALEEFLDEKLSKKR